MTDTANQPKDLLDWAALDRWMDAQDLPPGAIESPELLGGGTQNILIRFSRGTGDYVLRRPPLHKRAGSDETMRREARMLAALADSNVPHPAFIAGCPDESVLGAAFYLMQPVDGFNATVAMPSPHRDDADWRLQMGLSMAEGIAALGQVDHLAAGLADMDRSQDFLARQVPRWRKQLDSYSQIDGYSGAQLPDVDAIGRWLEANRPPDQPPGILHGDCHLANVMFRHDAPRMAAIVDWELSTIGDPMLDLGWLLATWPENDGRTPLEVVNVTPWEGFPDEQTLVAHYAAHSQRDTTAVDWYAVLACYKLAIILEGTHARACAGKAPKQTGDLLHQAALILLERAQTRIHGR